MIIYTVIVTIIEDIDSDWVKWMKEVHIPDVIKTGYFFDSRIRRRLIPEDSNGEITYIIDYLSNSLNDYKKYTENDATRLQNEHNMKFGEKFKALRTVSTVLTK